MGCRSSIVNFTVLAVTVMMLISSIGIYGATNQMSPGPGPAGMKYQESSDIFTSRLSSSFPTGSQGKENVNPLLYYSSEPAPMGIADFGLSTPIVPGVDYNAYSYNTTEFMGIANVSSLKTYNSSSNISNNMTIQLNVNLAFYNNNTLFVYWIQDVAYIDTFNNSIQFLDNVWNFSSTGASMHNSTIQGNGTVAKSSSILFYYDIANYSLPGNNISLASHYTLHLLVKAGLTPEMQPTVSFEYNDGFGWIVFDNVVFKFASNTGNSINPDGNFFVDGAVSNPLGTNYDAELILGGPGNGTSVADNLSNIQLKLEYWNGHNFQIVKNAFNFGTDTAETISNVVSKGFYNTTSGSIFSLVTNGTGSLGEIYDTSTISTLNLKTGLSSGNLMIGNNSHEFVNSWVNVTVGPGNYSLVLYDSSGIDVWNRTVDLRAGETLNLTTQSFFNVTFTPLNLPSGTIWYLNITGEPSSGRLTANTYSLSLPNGTYNFTTSTIDKNYRSPAGGTFTVAGASISIQLNFTLVRYYVEFIESGLLSGISWSVTLKSATMNSTALNSTLNNIIFDVPNGSYTFSVKGTSGFTPDQSNGAVIVDGGNQTRTVNFTYIIYLTGTLSPSSATFLINNREVHISKGHFNVSLTPGTYNLEVSAPGYSPYFNKTTLTYNSSKTLTLNISLKPSTSQDTVTGGAVIVVIAAIIVISIIAARRRRR